MTATVGDGIEPADESWFGSWQAQKLSFLS